ncbi:MAG TPA: hypothetical protein VGK73_33280, partial [Polyangiaceae bacterium]
VPPAFQRRGHPQWQRSQPLELLIGIRCDAGVTEAAAAKRLGCTLDEYRAIERGEMVLRDYAAAADVIVPPT